MTKLIMKQPKNFAAAPAVLAALSAAFRRSPFSGLVAWILLFAVFLLGTT